MDAKSEWKVESTLERANQISGQMPSWEGGFALCVVESIEALQAEINRLENILHNERSEGIDMRLCKCGRKHTKVEIGGDCLKCGGAVEGAMILSK